MAVVCGTLAACDHRHRLDRFVLLFHRARPRPRETAAPAGGGLWRGMAGAWRRLLPHPEIPGRAGPDARASDLVQMGKLRHLAVRLPDARHCLLRRRGPLPDRHSCRSEEHTSELQSLMRISYAVFCL